MPSTAIISGILLILIGALGYVFGLIDGHGSPTALIPAAFGILLLIFGFLAKSNENLRKHLMHAAVLVGLIGFVIPAYRLLSKINDLNVSLAVLSQAAMAIVCLFFVILCIQSFVNARRSQIIDA